MSPFQNFSATTDAKSGSIPKQVWTPSSLHIRVGFSGGVSGWIIINPISQLVKQAAYYGNHQSKVADQRAPPMGHSKWGFAPAVVSTLGLQGCLGRDSKSEETVTEPAPGEPLIFERIRAREGGKRNTKFQLSRWASLKPVSLMAVTSLHVNLETTCPFAGCGYLESCYAEPISGFISTQLLLAGCWKLTRSHSPQGRADTNQYRNSRAPNLCKYGPSLTASHDSDGRESRMS